MPSWLGAGAVDLGALVVALALLIVTFWYAKTTSDMAKSAQHSAGESARATAAAERSAKAALDAARVAQSQIVVEFEGRRIGLQTEHELVPTVEIRSAGDPVVVQGVRVRRAFRASSDGELDEAASLVEAEMATVGEIRVPRRLHRGERIHFTHPAMLEGEGSLARFILGIRYTFSEDGGEGGERTLVISEKTLGWSSTEHRATRND